MDHISKKKEMPRSILSRESTPWEYKNVSNDKTTVGGSAFMILFRAYVCHVIVYLSIPGPAPLATQQSERLPE